MATTDKEKSEQEKTIQVLVAKRRSVDVDGVLYGPGTALTLPISEAKSLYDKGFVVEPDYIDAEAASDGGSVQIEGQ